jgi:hypothetical protein
MAYRQVRSSPLFIRTAFVLVAALLVCAHSVPARAGAGETVVGSFEIQVQIQQRRVTVRDLGGSAAAALPSTALSAEFLSWDADDERAEISVAVKNIGAASLFGPLEARVVKLASPFTAAVAPDFVTGWSYDGADLGGLPFLPAGTTSEARTWSFVSPHARAFKLDVEVVARVPQAPGAGGIFEGPGGVTLSVPEGSVPYEALFGVRLAEASEIEAPLGDLTLVAVVEVIFEPTDPLSLFPAPSEPFEISLPDPAVGTDDFIIALQQLADDVESGGLALQLVPLDTASAVGGQIVSDGGNGFDGILEAGLYAILANFGSGYVEGTVSDASGPRAGAVVSNDTNTLVDVTDGGGRYRLYVNGGPFTVTAFDPLRGTGGMASGNIAVSGSTVTADVTLAALTDPPVTRDGIRNSGFELGNLDGWQFTGSANVVEELAATGATIEPTEGDWMADFNTGTGAVGGVGSSLRQRFRVPAGVQTLRLDFNFVSEEFPEFVGSIFDDAFEALVTTPDGDQVFAEVSVNSSGGFTSVGDCGFPGGDATCAQTGWREASVDLTAYSGLADMIEVTLRFSAVDAGDSIYDTHVLVDNIRFSTLWIDAKILAGAAANQARVEQDVANANEVLSQAGIIVRLRGVSTIATPGDLLDLEVSGIGDFEVRNGVNKLVPSAEEVSLLGMQRSAVDTDLNAYYVRSMNGPIGRSAQPDDYHDLTYTGTSGLFLADGVASRGAALAHEAAHLIISPERAGDATEHSAPAGNFMVDGIGTDLNRDQSQTINDGRVPLLVD